MFEPFLLLVTPLCLEATFVSSADKMIWKESSRYDLYIGHQRSMTDKFADLLLLHISQFVFFSTRLYFF